MKIKSIVIAVLAASTFGAGAATVTNKGMLTELASFNKSSTSIQKNKVKLLTLQDKASQASYFQANKHSGTERYIVRLKDRAVSSYKGDIKGFEKTNSSVKRSGLNNPIFNAKSSASLKYADYLEKKQVSLMSSVSSTLGFNMPKLRSYKYALNGLLTELTFAQAQAVGQMQEVAFIAREEIRHLETDTGPVLIGAPAVWDGTAGSSEYMGEGLVIGILDTGVNTDHRSFAATGDDDYTVVNPLGADTYLGDCVADASLCNSKLIGVYSYAEITDSYSDAIFAVEDQRPANGEDYAGHGSHTSSTAGGNVLRNVVVPQFDPYGGNTGDGVPTDQIIGQMSGVAPHANIISYQVCLPGSTGDTFSGCLGGSTVAAIEQAIIDGVDVLNYSIGGTTNFSPWESAIEFAFLNANSAGIFVATSAGNSGADGAGSSTKSAPWYTAVGATTHGNAGIVPTPAGKTIGAFTGGDTTVPASITGGGTNLNFTGEIVYAGDFDNANDPGGDSAQCLQPFPVDTFTATQIVVCDRGAIARTAKAENVASGSAGGYVLANANAAQTIAEDYYQVPGIHISFDDGVILKTWLASGSDHTATIGAASFERLTNVADAMAGFSSMGPNTNGGIIVPSIAAPGVSVFAATADDTPFSDVNTATPMDFNFNSGTSMASPHIAGSAILVKQAHPDWNPDQIRSALMMTATTNITKEDGTTAADPFDMGAGRVQVDLAINAGLVMSETGQNYFDAYPGFGGDATTLNVPSMAMDCVLSCVWTRRFDVVETGTYTLAGGSSALTTDVTSFTAEAGDTQSIVFTLDVSSASNGVVFDSVTISADGQPDLHLPVAIMTNKGSVPEDVVLSVGNNKGSWRISGLETIATDALSFVVDGVYDLNATGLTEILPFDIPQDPTTGTIEGLLDIEAGGLFHYPVEVPANTSALNVAISEATATDNDLYVMFDSNGDGVYNALVLQSASGETNETGSISTPEEGSYLVIVQNWGASAADSDSGVLTVEVVPVTDPFLTGLVIDAPTSNDGALDIRLDWDIEMQEGAAWVADVTVFVGTADIGTFNVLINRIVDDVSATANRSLVERGERIEYTLRMPVTAYPDDADYSMAIEMPDNMTILPGSVSGDGITLDGEQGFTWNVQRNVPFTGYVASSNAVDASCNADSVYGDLFSSYVGLSGFVGFTPSATMVGDTFGEILFADTDFPFYAGTRENGITVTDDGFIVLSGLTGQIGAAPWANTSIPNSAEPNDMIALMWRDMLVVADDANGRGIYTFHDPANGLSYIDYANVESWSAAGGDPDRFSFGVFIWHEVQEGRPQIIVSYSANQIGDFSGAVAGTENADGTSGTDASSLIAAGTQICYDYRDVNQAPVEVTFTVITKPGYAGQTAAPLVTVSSTMATSVDYSFRAAPVDFVNVAPIANAGSDLTLDRANPPTLVIMSAVDSTDVDGDSLTYSWEQSDGDSVVLTGTNADVTHFNFASAANGVYRFRVTVSDGVLSSTDEVSITIAGEDKNGGDGSLGAILLLVLGALYTRRKFKK